jgi:F0F1-type ATP synthase assembly protein I
MGKKLSAQEIRELSNRNKTKRKMLSVFRELRTAQNTMMLFRTMLAAIVWTMIIMLIARFFMISPWFLSPIPAIVVILGIIRMLRTDPLKKQKSTIPHSKSS